MAGHNLKCYHDIIFMMSEMMMCIYIECINLFCPTVKHSLKYITTASSGLPDFPEYVVAAMVDDNLVGNCDGSKKIIDLKHDWMKKVLKDDPHQLEYYKGACFDTMPTFFKATINSFKQRFNQSGGTVCTMLYFTFYFMNCSL